MPQTGEHRWGGIVFDAFAYQNGSDVEVWTVEDGGRIRHRDPSSGEWSFQEVPAQVKDTLHRVTFLTSGSNAGQMGWAVGQGGWVLKTTTAGDEWFVVAGPIEAPQTFPVDPDEELYDIHFVNESDGWMVGRQSFWSTDDGGENWYPVQVWDPVNEEYLDLTATAFRELYSLDVIERSDGSRLGLAVMQPGWVLRSESTGTEDPNHDLLTWELVWDIRSLCPGNVRACKESTTAVLKDCECDICGPNHAGPWFEPWDLEISRNTTSPLALFSGGHGFQCGMVFSSTDEGLSWTKEWHECQCSGTGCKDCSSDPDYNDNPSSPDLNRHQAFKTLYGLAIQDGNNSAIAAGYNGQLIVRDPATGVWNDRSMFSPAIPTTAGCVKYPMSGVDALAGSWTPSSGSGFGVVVGMGGHILETADGGSTYDIDFDLEGGAVDVIGEPHRTQSVTFVTHEDGWQGGQFYRVAISGDEAIHWIEQDPEANPDYGMCRAIAFSSNGQDAVTVGDSYTDPVSDSPTPRILYSQDSGQTWETNASIVNTSSFYLENDLTEATWAPSGKFWAVGTGGLILNSDDNGETWAQYLPSGETNFHQFQLEGVSFLDSDDGVFVGARPQACASGATRGVAYHLHDASTKVWTQIDVAFACPTDPPSGTSTVALLDVAWDAGSSAMWAVGEKMVSGNRQGILLRADWSGSSFDDFEEDDTIDFPLCLTGGERDESPVLTEVEVAPLTGDLWVGGMCGRIWVRRASNGAWHEVKSQTSAHVTDMSFATNGSEPFGYVNGFRTGPLQQCLVRLRD